VSSYINSKTEFAKLQQAHQVVFKEMLQDGKNEIDIMI
jgi:hypothetical protein